MFAERIEAHPAPCGARFYSDEIVPPHGRLRFLGEFERDAPSNPAPALRPALARAAQFAARSAGLSVFAKMLQLWNVGAGLPLDALKKGTIVKWTCEYELGSEEVKPLLDALSKNGSVGYDARDGDFPRHTTIANNVVRELGIWEKQSSAWFQAKAMQTTIVDNLFFNGPRAGINFNGARGPAVAWLFIEE